jgi:hypothetical protein
MTRATSCLGAYAASAVSTNAGFLAIPAYNCGISHDHFCGFSAITFAGFHSIRNTRKGVAIWSQDKDFEVSGLPVWKTGQVLRALGR